MTTGKLYSEIRKNFFAQQELAENFDFGSRDRTSESPKQFPDLRVELIWNNRLNRGAFAKSQHYDTALHMLFVVIDFLRALETVFLGSIQSGPNVAGCGFVNFGMKVTGSDFCFESTITLSIGDSAEFFGDCHKRAIYMLLAIDIRAKQVHY